MDDKISELLNVLEKALSEQDYDSVAKRAANELTKPGEFHLFRYFFFMEVDSPYFDPGKAEEALLLANEFDDISAPWRLAMGYASGSFGAVNIERAEIFRERAAKLGNPGAQASQFYMALFEFMSVANRGELDPKTRAVLDSTFGADHHSMPGGMLMSACGFIGLYVKKDIPTSMDILLNVARFLKSNAIGPSIDATIIATVINIFGLSQKFDQSEAMELLSYIPETDGINNVRLSNALKAEKLYATFNIESNLDPSASFEIHRSKTLLLSIWEAESDADAVKLIETAIRDKSVTLDLQLLWYIDLILVLSDWCFDHRSMAFNQLKHRCEISYLGVTWSEVEKNTKDCGPQFNHLNGAHPIIGSRIWPDEVGFATISGVKLGSAGLGIIGEYSENEALVFERDIVDALAFSYGWSDVVWPTLSIEPIGSMTGSSIKFSLRRKVFHPPGFATTDIGRTFFQADWLLGRVSVFDPKYILNTNPEISKSALEAAKFLYDGFNGLGGVEVGLWGRVMLRPNKVEVYEKKESKFHFPKRSSERVFEVSNLQILVDGAGCIDIDAHASQRDLRLNDIRFAAGRLAGYITDNIPLIKELLPVYGRLEQLYRLLSILGYMREQKIELPEHLQRTASLRATELAAVQSNADKSMIVLP